MDTQNIVVIVGSLRKDSINKSVARTLAALSVPGLVFDIVDLAEIPMYNQDLENVFPEAVITLKNKIRNAQGIIVVTPEYNRSIPGMLKNVLDWTSRPYGDNAWAGKAVGTMGASVSPLGTAIAQDHLRSILTYFDAHVLGQPEIYIGSFMEKVDATGNITDGKTLEFLKMYLEKFHAHTLRFNTNTA